VNWIVATLAIVAAFDVAQRCRQLRDATAPQRLVVATGALVVAIGLAALSSPLLDSLDISAPNMQIGAGIVLGVYSIVALVTWDDAPAPAALYGGLMPLLFPIVLTPAVGVVVLAVAARNGILVPTVGSGVVAALLAWPASSASVGHRPIRMLSAAVGIVSSVAMIVDGAFAV
jgi:hypothetical protein